MESDTLTTLVKSILLSFTLSKFEPLQMLIQFSLTEKMRENSWVNKLYYLLTTLTTCHKCLGFWITLILTKDLLLASGMFTFLYIGYNIINEYEKKNHPNRNPFQ